MGIVPAMLRIRHYIGFDLEYEYNNNTTSVSISVAYEKKYFRLSVGFWLMKKNISDYAKFLGFFLLIIDSLWFLFVFYHYIHTKR